jgi:hypothetical protein
LKTVCPGWLQTVILLISASQVARLTGMSHQCLAINVYFNTYILNNMHIVLYFVFLSVHTYFFKKFLCGIPLNEYTILKSLLLMDINSTFYDVRNWPECICI